MPQRSLVVDVRRPVQRHHTISSRRKAEALARAAGLDSATHELVRINHDIANALYWFRWHAFGAKIDIRIRRGRPQQVCECVGDEAVDFLWHPPVATSETGLEMRNPDPEFGTHQRASHSRVDVADHEDPF